MFHNDNSVDGKLLKAQLHPIRRIVCSGGGAKGVVYAGAFNALEDAGIAAGIRDAAGASAGALTASLIACGMSAKSFREKLLNTNMA